MIAKSTVPVGSLENNSEGSLSVDYALTLPQWSIDRFGFVSNSQLAIAELLNARRLWLNS